MRYVLAAAIVIGSTVPSFVNALPWEKHPLLSFPNTPMTEAPGDGLVGDRTARAYFEKLDQAGYRCDAQDKPARHIHIVCRNADRNTLDYDGQFVGAGYLELDRVKVDGKPLSRTGSIVHQDRVYGDKPARLEGE